MRVTVKHPGSGTFASDAIREGEGHTAANILEQGKSVKCVAGDHAGSDTCCETIIKQQNNPAKASFDPTDRNTTLTAVKKLREGVGVNAVSGTHSGGNTCAQVIAAIDDSY